MKVLTRKNLINILKKGKQNQYIDEYDIEKIFAKYGGEMFIVDGKLEILEEEIKV